MSSSLRLRRLQGVVGVAQIKTIADLTPDPQNARRHNPRNVGMLERSLNEVGAARSIVIDEDGVILAGNATIEAAAQAGIERVQVVEADGDTIIAVRRTGLTAEQKTKLALYDNRVAELAEWEPGVLAELAVDFDLSDLFTAVEFADLAQPVLPEPGGGGDEFDATPEEGETRTHTGELWSIGGVHRLVVGDCTDAATVSLLMDGERAVLVFEDPPYNVAYQDNESIESLKARNRRTDGKIVENDAMTDEQFDTFLDAFIAALPLAPGGAYYLCAPPGHPETQFRNALNRVSGCELRQCIVWIKDRFVFGRQDYHWRHESILYGWKEGAAHYFVDDRTQDTVWEIARPTDSPDHPTQKPIALPIRAIENSSRLGDIVFDGFLGSGTTLIAAHRTGRRCYGCEISPRYADVILRRAEAEGLECELLTDG
jgi:DNA modification methylase